MFFGGTNTLATPNAAMGIFLCLSSDVNNIVEIPVIDW